MSTAQNNLVRKVGGKNLSHPILSDGLGDINQGDLVYFDSGVVKSIASNANAATVAGVALKSSFLNLYGTKKYEGSMQVGVGDIFEFLTTSGETLSHGDAVGIGTDAQIVSEAAANKVGYVMLRDGQSDIVSTGVEKVDVFVVGKFPLNPTL
jgi:hypothetical protein